MKLHKLISACLLWLPITLAEAAQPQPNIIVILADDLGYGDIGVNGATQIYTPNIDKLAAEGVNFTQFFASANICTPSRAGLLSGQYPIRTGLGYSVVKAGDSRGLPRDTQTIADLAHEQDYKTMMVGKWHLGDFPKHSPLYYGFDTFYGVPYSNDMKGFALYDGLNKIEQPVDQALLTQKYTRQSVKFINKNADSPFLLYLSHSMPHIPLYASKEFIGSSKAGTYGDVVQELDWSVGKIVEALKNNKLFDNTLIFITSDNGPFFEGSTSGLKGNKGSTFEGAYRVPLVASWPKGKLTTGNNNVISMNIDLLPTIAQTIRATPKSKVIDGKSLLPALRGGQGPHRYLYFFNNEDVVAIRSQRWKFLTQSYYRTSIGDFAKFGQLPGFKQSYDLLFDAEAANGEAYSVADRHPITVKKLRSALEKAQHDFDLLRTRSKDKTFPE